MKSVSPGELRTATARLIAYNDPLLDIQGPATRRGWKVQEVGAKFLVSKLCQSEWSSSCVEVLLTDGKRAYIWANDFFQHTESI